MVKGTRSAFFASSATPALGWRMVSTARLSGCHGLVGKFSRADGGGDGRPAPVHGSAQLPVRPGLIDMRPLRGYGPDTPLTSSCFLRSVRTRYDASRPTVEA